MTHNKQRLEEHIRPLSENNQFSIAKTEWKLVDIEICDDFDHCPCGQGIKELCHIENTLNGNRTYVGNVCVKRFLGIDTGSMFDGLKRITADLAANPNHDLIVHAHRLGYLHGDNEYEFLMQIKNKRKLSQKQIAWKKKINRRIVAQSVVRKDR